MLRITNVNSMIAARVLNTQMNKMNQSLERLSTGLRINRAADDPAGLIASETLRSEKVGLEAAIANGQRAMNVAATAEGGLQEVSSLLLQLESLVVSAANKGGQNYDELEAKQLQVDSILDAIARISNTTTFNGMKLLNGRLDYTTAGVPASDISQVRVDAAKMAQGQSKNVVVEVYASAQAGQVKFTGATTATNVTLQVGGEYGTQLFSFAAGTAIATIANALNANRDLIGVSATASAGELFFTSTGYGSDAFVSVQTVNGTFAVTGGTNGTDHGVDPKVRINGQAASAKGLKASISSPGLALTVNLNPAFAQKTSAANFSITGGGATFSLAPDIMTGLESIAFHSTAPGTLGDAESGNLNSLASGNANALTGPNLMTAQRIVKAAIQQVAVERGRLGAFQQYTVGSQMRSMQVALENITEAESAIRDTDFAEETASFTRSQILVQAASSMLRQANKIHTQTILALLS